MMSVEVVLALWVELIRDWFGCTRHTDRLKEPYNVRMLRENKGYKVGFQVSPGQWVVAGVKYPEPSSTGLPYLFAKLHLNCRTDVKT